MSAVKLGYVVMYPCPAHEKSVDEFLKIDTSGPTLKTTTTAILDQATVFDNEAAAGTFLSIVVPNRSPEVREVHQVTHRKLAEKPFDPRGILAAYASRNPPKPGSIYSAPLGHVDDRIPMGAAVSEDGKVAK